MTPAPRPRVLAFLKFLSPPQPKWWYLVDGYFQTDGDDTSYPHNLRVVSHSKNDPEAVKLIEEARRA